NAAQLLRNVCPAVVGSIFSPNDSVLAVVSSTSVPPVTAAPACELCAINRAAFAVFESTVSSARGPSRQYAKGLNDAGCGIDSKGAVPHSERGIGRGNALQLLS